jgi:hypothetical protein
VAECEGASLDTCGVQFVVGQVGNMQVRDDNCHLCVRMLWRLCNMCCFKGAIEKS